MPLEQRSKIFNIGPVRRARDKLPAGGRIDGPGRIVTDEPTQQSGEPSHPRSHVGISLGMVSIPHHAAAIV